MDRVILHSDLNNFYASAEVVRDASLRALPIAVAGSVEDRHGIVLAKSYEAKRFGVATGDTLMQARAKCPDIRFIPPDFKLYAELSEAVREIYLSYTDAVESFGPDECWLDVTGSLRLFAPDAADAHEGGILIADTIRRRVKRETGLTVSVGVSFNKTMAKLASDMKKPDATVSLPRECIRERVWPLPVEELLYVGPKTAERLRLYGIDTVGRLAEADEGFLRLLLGRQGAALRQSARGEEGAPVVAREERPRAKSVSCGTTARHDMTECDELCSVLRALCVRVSSRLREMRVLCRTVSVTVREYDLYSFERQTGLCEPSRTSEALFDAARAILFASRRDRPIRSLTLRASSLVDEEDIQLTMFPTRHAHREELESCVDELRRRYGSKCMSWGVAPDALVDGFSH